MKNNKIKQKFLNAVREEKGFTFIEVIIVMSIIMILSAVLIPSYFGFVETARKSNVKLSANNVYSAVQMVNIEVGTIDNGEIFYNNLKELTPGLAGVNTVDNLSDTLPSENTAITLNGKYTGAFNANTAIDLKENQFAISAVTTAESGFSFTYYQCINDKVYVVTYVNGIAGEPKAYAKGAVTNNNDSNGNGW